MEVPKKRPQTPWAKAPPSYTDSEEEQYSSSTEGSLSPSWIPRTSRKILDQTLVVLDINGVEHTNVIMNIWLGLDGIESCEYIRAGVLGVTANGSILDILQDYVNIILRIGEEKPNTSIISYMDSDGSEKTFDLKFGLDAFATYGNLALQVSDVLSEHTSIPSLYFMLHELMHNNDSVDLEDNILITSGWDKYHFSIPPDRKKYYKTMEAYLIDNETSEVTKMFRQASNEVLKLARPTCRQILTIVIRIVRT